MIERTAAFHTLGCKVNAYETEAMEELLAKAGYRIVPFTEKADVYVVNTCAVTGIAERKSRQMLHRAKKLNPEAVVVAAGCYVQVSAQEVEADPAVDLMLGSGQKRLIADLLEAHFAGQGFDEAKRLVIDREYEALEVSTQLEHTRAFVKVQDGCNQFCSYCIIPFARGQVRSRGMSSVVSELERLAASGIREVVLTGIHLSSYGRDWDDERHLAELVEASAAVPGIARIRLGSLEPGIITEEFARRLKATGKVCPHFHLSLQSGCAATLKRMNRHYTPEEYARKVAILREVFDDPAITTDVIVGFPGESEEEFETTAAFLEGIRFAGMHVFKYSRRKGTRADLVPDQVPEEAKAARSDRLLALADTLEKAYGSGFIGREVEVLAEEESGEGDARCSTGFTPEYLRCACPGVYEENTLVRGRITGRRADGLWQLESLWE